MKTSVVMMGDSVNNNDNLFRRGTVSVETRRVFLFLPSRIISKLDACIVLVVTYTQYRSLRDHVCRVRFDRARLNNTLPRFYRLSIIISVTKTNESREALPLGDNHNTCTYFRVSSREAKNDNAYR